MQVREYCPLMDYAILRDWWHDWLWTPCPTPEMLSCNGLIIWADDIPLAAGFVYKTDSVMAWIEHIVSNKRAKPKLRAKALELLIPSLTDKAKDMGFKFTLTSLEHERLKELFARHGYQATDKEMTNMVRML